MDELHPYEPTKAELLVVFKRALTYLRLDREEVRLLHVTFDISFDGHEFAPRRESGEIYFMHVFRQFILAIILMKRFKVVSFLLLAAILLHDTIEDAEKGKSTRFLAKANIHLRLNNDRLEYAVMCMTKKKHEGETRTEFLKRIIASEIWEVLVAKPFDGNDNIVTLHAMPFEKQQGKVDEVFTHYPHIEDRAIHLITVAGKEGKLSHVDRWILLVKTIHRILRRNTWREARRIEKEQLTIPVTTTHD